MNTALLLKRPVSLPDSLVFNGKLTKAVEDGLQSLSEIERHEENFGPEWRMSAIVRETLPRILSLAVITGERFP